MATLLTPLAHNVPIVDANGNPTSYFQRMLQQLLKEKKATDELAEGAVPGETEVIAGVGLSGGGPLSADVTVDLDAVLDDLTDVDTTTAPPTDGQALVYDDGLELWLPGTISGGGSGTFSGALAHKSADQNAINAVASHLSIPWDSEAYDTDNYHDTSSNTDRLTVAEDGKYLVSCNIRAFNVGSGTYLRIYIEHYDNLGVVKASRGLPEVMIEGSHSGFFSGNLISAPVLCVTGDYFVVRLQSESDTSISILNAYSWFAIERKE
jgi:hypothetical protein